MLRVHASVVVDRAEVDSDVRVLVDLEQLAHRLLVVALRPDRAEPEPEERPPDGVGEEDASGSQRHAPADATLRPDARVQRCSVTTGSRARRPRKVARWKRARAESRPRQRQHCAAQRAQRTCGHRAEGIAVLAQDVADARTFTCADRAQRGRRQHLLVVHDDERRVVLDARARVECAHEVFDLFS